MFALSLSDLFSAEQNAKTEAALARYTITPVYGSDDPEFSRGYDALSAVFTPRGELERREVLVEWLSGPFVAPIPRPIEVSYVMLVARDETGAFAGVRDCYVTVDRAASRCVVCLSHVLVMPEHRRSGLASLLRAAPVVLGRKTGAHKIFLAAEMEPFDPEDADTWVRLVAYGRSGFAVIPTEVLPYCQPDFSDPKTRTAPPRPIPLLAVVRRIGHEDQTQAPRELAEHYLTHFFAEYARSCDAREMSRLRRYMTDSISRQGETISLRRLPRSEADKAQTAPLSRLAVLPHYAWLDSLSSAPTTEDA
jgi:GNAT superfamily N-acetyltransferase